MAAPRMARRETPVNRYSLDPLVKVTRTVPLKGSAMTLRAQELNLELIGSIGLSRLVDVLSLQGQGQSMAAICATL